MLMTGQFSHKEGGLTINGDIKGLMCPMVVDTGANVKVVRLDMLGKRTLSRLRATNNVLKTAADETAGSVWKTDPLGQDWGYASLAWSFGWKYFRQVNIRPRLPDRPWLYRWCRGRKPTNWIHKPLSSEQPRCYRVTVVEYTLILPHSEAIVAAKIMDNTLYETWGTIGPSMTAMFPPDVMVGETLIDAQNDYVPVRVINLSGEPRNVCSGTKVASCEPVESVLHEQLEFGPESQKTGGDLPDHLKDLFTRSAEGLSDGQQHQLLELLCEFQDIFSRGPQDLGRTG